MRSVGILAFVLSLSGAAHAEVLTLEQVVSMATTSHPRLAAARARARSAEAARSSARGRLLPLVNVSEEYQHWDKPFTVAFGPQSFTARDQDTNTLTVSASQPVLGLLRRGEELHARTSAARAADAGVKVGEATTREAVSVQYLQLFEAMALRDVAKASQAELAQQVENTRAKVNAGTLTKADLLRVQVALANARQQEIVATTQLTVARANLLSAIGMDPNDQTTQFAEPTPLLTAARRSGDAAARAIGERPELEQARLQAESAHHQERARFYALFPEVDVEAAYTRVDGQAFAPKNSAFVGVRVGWPIWEWGASAAARRAASEEEVAARSEVEAERRDIQAELTARRAELSATASAVALAEQTIASAEEAYRVTDAVVKAGAGTTTDLLDAESALTQARLSLAQARYEEAIAHVRLKRALGVP